MVCIFEDDRYTASSIFIMEALKLLNITTYFSNSNKNLITTLNDILPKHKDEDINIFIDVIPDNTRTLTIFNSYVLTTAKMPRVHLIPILGIEHCLLQFLVNSNYVDDDLVYQTNTSYTDLINITSAGKFNLFTSFKQTTYNKIQKKLEKEINNYTENKESIYSLEKVYKGILYILGHKYPCLYNSKTYPVCSFYMEGCSYRKVCQNKPVNKLLPYIDRLKEFLPYLIIFDNNLKIRNYSEIYNNLYSIYLVLLSNMQVNNSCLERYLEINSKPQKATKVNNSINISDNTYEFNRMNKSN